MVLLILLLALLISIPGIFTGIGMMSFKMWSRFLGIVISILQLFNFPLGTGLGFYGLWVLFSRDGAALFERPPVSVPRTYSP
jgi:Na+-driven multidrug efflux pump